MVTAKRPAAKHCNSAVNSCPGADKKLEAPAPYLGPKQRQRMTNGSLTRCTLDETGGAGEVLQFAVRMWECAVNPLGELAGILFIAVHARAARQFQRVHTPPAPPGRWHHVRTIRVRDRANECAEGARRCVSRTPWQLNPERERRLCQVKKTQNNSNLHYIWLVPVIHIHFDFIFVSTIIHVKSLICLPSAVYVNFMAFISP